MTPVPNSGYHSREVVMKINVFLVLVVGCILLLGLSCNTARASMTTTTYTFTSVPESITTTYTTTITETDTNTITSTQTVTNTSTVTQTISAPPTTITVTPTPSPTTPASFDVEINYDTFIPATITVPVGATVTWSHLDREADSAVWYHTVTSETGLFDSGLLTFGDIFSYTFTEPGTYHYYNKELPYRRGIVIVE